MDFGNAREVLADDLHRVHAAERQVPGVRREPDVLGIGELHHPADFALAFYWSPDMRMRREADADGNRLPADLVQRVGEPLQLIVGRTAWRPVAHVALPQIAAEGLEKLARERHVIGNRLRGLILVDEVRRLPARAVRHIDHRQPGFVEEFLERQRIASVLLDLVAVRLDALQAQFGDALDRPLDLVLPAPQRARASETDVRVDGIERPMRDRAPQVDGSPEGGGGRHAAHRQRMRDELAAIEAAAGDATSHRCLLERSAPAQLSPRCAARSSRYPSAGGSIRARHRWPTFPDFNPTCSSATRMATTGHGLPVSSAWCKARWIVVSAPRPRSGSTRKTIARRAISRRRFPTA